MGNKYIFNAAIASHKDVRVDGAGAGPWPRQPGSASQPETQAYAAPTGAWDTLSYKVFVDRLRNDPAQYKRLILGHETS